MVAEFCCSLKPGLSGPRRMLLSPRQACCPKTQCTAGRLWRALLPPFGEHTFIQKKNTDRVSMCQRRNSKSQLGFPTWKEEGRVGQQRCLQTSSGPVWKSKACSESQAREGHKEAHLKPSPGGFPAAPAALSSKWAAFNSDELPVLRKVQTKAE